MQLSELFVSHKQVEPVSFKKSDPELEKPIYFNLERAQAALSPDPETSSEETPSNMSTWKVKGPDSSSWVNPYAKDQAKWKADMTAAYKRAGLNDNAIRNLLAKNALESGWGKSAQGDFNFGNITTGSSWKGRFVNGKDKDGSGKEITQKFRAYDNLDAYVDDEVKFLTSLYDFNQDDDFDTFIGKLQGNNSGKRSYAADKDYANKVRGIYRSI